MIELAITIYPNPGPNPAGRGREKGRGKSLYASAKLSFPCLHK